MIESGATVELISLGKDCNFRNLRIGMKGIVKGICKDYLVWVKFIGYFPEPNEEPSPMFGFPLYFDEVREIRPSYLSLVQPWDEYVIQSLSNPTNDAQALAEVA